MLNNSSNTLEQPKGDIDKPRRLANRLNSIFLGIVCGLLAGLFLFSVTFLSFSKFGPHGGEFLGLLPIFFPGYSVTPLGALAGFFWGFIVGAISGFLVYWTHAQIVGMEISSLESKKETPHPLLHPSMLRIAPHSLALALGSLLALQLFITTNWLVIRGTADESVHAALLSHYLPLYTVSFPGSIYGSIVMFIFTYLPIFLFAVMYNHIVHLRHGDLMQ